MSLHSSCFLIANLLTYFKVGICVDSGFALLGLTKDASGDRPISYVLDAAG